MTESLDAIITAARHAHSQWNALSAYDRGQKLYHLAMVLEQYDDEMSIDAANRLLHYAGWTDKIGALYSSVNPVANGHFNCSMVEPVGVVGIVLGVQQPLMQLISLVAPAICSGNSVIVLMPGDCASIADIFDKLLTSCGMPDGVVNLFVTDDTTHALVLASHSEVNAMVFAGDDDMLGQTIGQTSAEGVKRMVTYQHVDWLSPQAQGLHMIRALMEVKSMWHPVG